MGRIRVAGIIPFKEGYAFMHRKGVKSSNSPEEYYVFCGGGVEGDETLENATIREIKEELGIDVKVIKKLYEIDSPTSDKKEYFFLCEYISGEFGTGEGPEFSNDPKYKDRGQYIPEIIKPEEIEDILILPNEIKQKFLNDIKSHEI